MYNSQKGTGVGDTNRGYTQVLFTPLHRPPQSVSSELHGDLPPTGAVAIGEQVPEPHASHCKSLVPA